MFKQIQSLIELHSQPNVLTLQSSNFVRGNLMLYCCALCIREMIYDVISSLYKEQLCNIRSSLMKLLDLGVEALGCHLDIIRVVSEQKTDREF